MLQSDWGWTVVADLFMSGFGACLFIAAAGVMLCSERRYKRSVRIGIWISFAAVALGVLFLLMDVGKPFRAMWLIGSFTNFDSWMPRGAWALAGAMAVYLLVGILGINRISDERSWVLVLRKVLAVLGIAVAGFVTIYTGFLVKGGEAIPFWNSPLIPLSFACASAAAGFSAMLAIISFTGEGKGSIPTNVLLAILAAAGSVAAIFVVQSLLGTMMGEGGTSATSAGWFKAQSIYLPALIGFGVSAAATLLAGVISALGKDSRVIAVVALVAAVFAGVALRYLVLGAGAHNPLPVPEVGYLQNGMYFYFR